MMGISHAIWGVLATLVGLVGYAAYVTGIVRGKVKPHIFSWFLWGVLMLVLGVAQHVERAGPGAWVTLVSGFSCLAIAFFAWRQGEKNITRSDWAAFTTGLATIPLWIFTQQPLFSVIVLTFIDIVAFYPTLRKSMIKPQEEDLSFYALTLVKFSIALLATEQMNLTNALYPVAMVFMNGLMTALLIRGCRKTV